MIAIILSLPPFQKANNNPFNHIEMELLMLNLSSKLHVVEEEGLVLSDH